MKPNEKRVVEAIKILINDPDGIEIFNKKAIYLYIREISDCKTQQITRVINRMKECQEKITKQYIEHGKI